LLSGVSAPYTAVVGAVNMDIGGHSFAPLLRRDSNPGSVSLSLGGVGRNIAHNLRLLGVPVQFVTALGEDLYARQVRESCGQLNIGLDGSVTVPGGKTSTYLFICGPDGDMELALSDTDIAGSLTPDFLATRLTLLNRAAAVVFDSNLPPESIAWLGDHVTAPLLADPVSAAKAPKLLPVLHRLHTFKPNLVEAERLTGHADPERAAEALLRAGVRRVFLSLGADGIYAAEAGRAVHLPCFPSTVKNATGGGDAGMAALVWAYLEGLNLEQSARAALAAGAIAVESEETISPLMGKEALRAKAGL
jgi:pseudouridine kinase